MSKIIKKTDEKLIGIFNFFTNTALGALLMSIAGLLIVGMVVFSIFYMISSNPYDKMTAKEQAINSQGVDGYCRDKASDFIKNTFDNQWGSEAERGNYEKIQEKIYTDCLTFNQK